jgi:hypothetical protein
VRTFETKKLCCRYKNRARKRCATGVLQKFSHTKIYNLLIYIGKVVGRVGLEPTTNGLWDEAVLQEPHVYWVCNG